MSEDRKDRPADEQMTVDDVAAIVTELPPRIRAPVTEGTVAKLEEQGSYGELVELAEDLAEE